jgi:putative ABC transport system permease protein
MLRHYLTAAMRSLARSWTPTFIAISGLAIGLTACLLILIYVRYELTYDHWLPDSERLYQLQTKLMMNRAGGEMLSQMSSYPAGASLQKDFPQIEKRVYAAIGFPAITYKGVERSPTDLLLVDGPFFDVIRLPFVEGDPSTALARVGSIVLTRSEAAKYFGNGPALGEVLTFKYEDIEHDYKVTGVIEDLPKNSHLKFTMLARFDARSPPPYTPSGDLTYWYGSGGWTYLKLNPAADPAAIRAAMPAWEKRNEPWAHKSGHDWQLVSIRDIHLGEALGPTPNADKGFLMTFGVVALLILGMACINFTNLATAQASGRAREVALRKLLGATKKQLVMQFLSEALLFTAIAMIIALSLVELLLPSLSRFLDAELAISYGDMAGTILPMLGLAVVVAVASGIYPSLYLSSFLPARVLKANASFSEAPGSGRLRTMLVVTQFAVSIGLIICTAIVFRQTVFARSLEAGYPQVGALQIRNAAALDASAETFAREVEKIAGVHAVARTALMVGTGPFYRGDFTEPGMAEPLNIDGAAIDPAFFPVMGIKLLAGRNLDPRRSEDLAIWPARDATPEQQAALAGRNTNVLINESAVRRLGFRTPATAVGKSLKYNYNGGRHSSVVGVVADARFTSVREPVNPMIFFYAPDQLGSLVVRYEDASGLAVRKQVEALWRRMAPQIPIQVEFTQEAVENLYRAEKARSKIFAAFALVAVLIACLGLYGLAAFTAVRRTKEIGIRKVLGARNGDIVKLLIWQFSKPVLIANLIAWPVAWWVMRDWLNGFDARISLTPGPFLLAGLTGLLIAVVTVTGHAVKVARARPIAALRYE